MSKLELKVKTLIENEENELHREYLTFFWREVRQCFVEPPCKKIWIPEVGLFYLARLKLRHYLRSLVVKMNGIRKIYGEESLRFIDYKRRLNLLYPYLSEYKKEMYEINPKYNPFPRRKYKVQTFSEENEEE